MKECAYVNEVFSVADEQVAEDPSLIQVPQTNHVLHAMDRGGVHWLDVGGILRGDPVFLKAKRFRALTWHTQQNSPFKGHIDNSVSNILQSWVFFF